MFLQRREQSSTMSNILFRRNSKISKRRHKERWQWWQIEVQTRWRRLYVRRKIEVNVSKQKGNEISKDNLRKIFYWAENDEKESSYLNISTNGSLLQRSHRITITIVSSWWTCIFSTRHIAFIHKKIYRLIEKHTLYSQKSIQIIGGDFNVELTSGDDVERVSNESYLLK